MTDTKTAPPAVEDDALIRRYLDTGCGQAANQLAERHVARTFPACHFGHPVGAAMAEADQEHRSLLAR